MAKRRASGRVAAAKRKAVKKEEGAEEAAAPTDAPPDASSWRTWTTAEVVSWLKGVNAALGKYASAFEEVGVTGDMLADLSDATLKSDLKVTTALHRKQILRAAAAVTGDDAAEPKVEPKVEPKAEPKAEPEKAEPKKAKAGGDREIELCVSFDTTGSMYPCLGEVKRRVKELVGRLLREVPHMKIALVAHGDYQDEGETYLLKSLNFSCDVDTLQRFTEEAGQTCGYDGDEAYEFVLREVQGLAWSPASQDKQRVLVLIGDANPHPLNSNNPHNIDWRVEADKLKARGVRVHAVHALARAHSRPFYEEVSQRTGGCYLELDQFASIRDLILSVAFAENSVEQLGNFEQEVQAGGRMTRSMKRMFDKLHGREPSAAATAEAGLDAVPLGRFQILEVDERMPIKQFAQSRGLIFKAGRGFYEFTKPEKISLKKEIVLRDRTTGDMFTGPRAREMLGVSAASAHTRLQPKDFDQFMVFVQSTSYNRVLMPGTKFLYEVDEDK